MRRLSWLYPAEWRQLYGGELDELLEQTPFAWHTLVDVLRGALDARLHPQRPRTARSSKSPAAGMGEASGDTRGGAAMRGPKMKPGPTMCSFCGKGPDQVKRLVAGPGVFICDSCVHLCNEVLEQDAGSSPVGGSGPGAHPPDRSRPRGRSAWSALREDLRRLWRGARIQAASS
jgi:hypothetical protein